MGLSVHLLGPPRLEREGVPLDPPRGHKGWGLLAHLVRARIPPSREHLAGLLFPEADDPLGALRWALSSLRRQLGADALLEGDPVRVTFAPGTLVDVDVLSRGSWMEAVALPGFGQELLGGLAFPSSPGFEFWLDAERRHVAGLTASVLHHAALALLARGEVEAATARATALVGLTPYDENGHVLLVRCLRAAGDPAAAHRHVDGVTALFRRELGRDPTPALRAAVSEVDGGLVPGVASRSDVLVRLETAKSALAAGAVEVGVQGIREAVRGARRLGDRELTAMSLVELGAALVHVGRGTDEEGMTALHESTLLATAVGRPDVAARGWREIGWVQYLRAEHERAEQSLDNVVALEGASEEDRAWVDVIRGSCRHDRGDHDAALLLLRLALDRSERLGAGLLHAYALTHLGRFHLLRGETEDAIHLLDAALHQCAARGLTAFVPWPESFRAEIDLLVGDLDSAAGRLEHAFALGCQVGDPCWESVGLRGLGLVAAARGDGGRALELLVQAPDRCRRLPDTYLWIETYGLDALCRVAIDHGAGAAPLWVDRLEATAARRGHREFVVRALVHRARLGDPGALTAARSLAAQIRSPALRAMLAGAGRRHEPA